MNNSSYENKTELVDRFVEAYKNRHDYNCVDEFIAENCRVHLPVPGIPDGREGMRINGQMVNTAFPDVHVEREFFAVDGDIVVERAHAKAIHKGELMGIAPTNKPVTWTELHAYRVENNMITEVWSEANFLGVIAQIGAVKLPPSAT